MSVFFSDVIDWKSIIIRVVFALIAGILIGVEREISNHQAGIKTHVLVCLGSALASMICCEMGLGLIQSTSRLNLDISRIAAGVIPGIGFIGAGAILKGRGGYVSGITTAATLWFTACLGLAIGMGYFKVSLVTFVAMYVSIILLKLIEKRFFNRRGLKCIEISMTNKRTILDFIKTYCDDRKIKIASHDYIGDKNEKDENGNRIYHDRYILWLPRKIDSAKIVRDWYMQDDVLEVREICNINGISDIKSSKETLNFEEHD